jgi:hypothetical protein
MKSGLLKTHVREGISGGHLARMNHRYLLELPEVISVGGEKVGDAMDEHRCNNPRIVSSRSDHTIVRH